MQCTNGVFGDPKPGQVKDCYYQDAGNTITPDSTKTVSCGNVQGRYVSINVPKTTPLTICEVEVRGEAMGPHIADGVYRFPEVGNTKWKLVRHVPAGNSWHPAQDQMTGSEAYGTYVTDNQGYPTMTSPAFSLKFNTMPCDHMLFATGDMRRWLSAEKAVVQGWYANGARPIIKSSASSATSKARWYRRESNKEDPWISITDHHTAIGAGDIVYGEKGFGGTHASTVLPGHAGANVFCKVVDPEDVCYVKSHTEKRCMNYKINGQWQRTFTKAASVQDCANLCKSKGNCNMFSFGSPEQPAGEVGSCLFAVAGCRLEGGGHARGYNTYTPQDCSSASDMQLEEGVFAEVAMINQQLKDAGVADVDAGVQAL